jgi:DNA-binding transcriptional LysR family regulator
MDKIQAMTVFCRVFEAESFKIASESLTISRPMVTRYIHFLETELGAKLIQRNTRNFSITEAGKQYYRYCIAILDAIEEAESEIGELSQQPKGRLRISVPMDYGMTHLSPLLRQFNQIYPDIQLDVDFNDKRVDLTEAGIDVAIRGGKLGGDQFVARPLTPIKMLVCAAPSYLAQKGVPVTPSDLVQHNCLLYSNLATPNRWCFYRNQQVEYVQVTGSLQANNGGALTRLAAAGLGIICQPDFLVEDYIHSGELVALLPEYGGVEGQFYVIYPQRKLLSRKTRLFVSYLLDNLVPQ